MEHVDHILIVDDDREIRELLSSYLTKNGLRTSLAADGRQMRAVLTDEGRRHVGAINLAVKATENLALAALTDKEIRQFLKVLRKINRNLGQVEPEGEAFDE